MHPTYRERGTTNDPDTAQRTHSRKIEAILPSACFDAIHTALRECGFDISFSEVRTSAGAEARRAVYRGAEYRPPTPRTKLEMLVPSERVPEAIDILKSGKQDGGHGASILVYDVFAVEPSAGLTSRTGRRFPSL